MRNYLILALLALASIAIIATYDFGKPDLPYTYEDISASQTVNKQNPSQPDKKQTDSVRTKNKSTTASSSSESVNPVYKVKLELAVVAAKASAECGMSSSAGYRHLTADAAAKELVLLMNSAQRPVAGEPPSPTPLITYVLDMPSTSWQVAVRADTEKNHLIIEGYGNDLQTPLFIESIPCS